jgi:ABC-type antimicrobial peptide transport system permease subunit
MNIIQSFRIITRNKTFSILNILGLATGITCAALILLWVEDEITYNDFPKQKQLYALYQNQNYSGTIYSFQVAPNPLAAVLKEEIKGIKNVTRFSGYNRNLFTFNDKMIYQTGAYADSSIFSMLNIEFIFGNAATAFHAAYPIVITEDMAAKFFGTDNPIEKSLKKENGQEYEVTAVIKNLNSNSDFTFSWLIPFQQLIRDYATSGYGNVETSWHQNWMNDYVELEPFADVNQVNEQIRDLLKEKRGNYNETTTLFLYPFSKMRLYNSFKDGAPTGSGFIRYVKMLFWIGMVILVIACINFMNLSTARSEKRTLEVGIRKTFGAGRLRLIGQFMSEAGSITIIALLLALVFIELFLPPFNNFTGKELTIGLNNPVHWAGLLSIGLLCIIIAGSYPAFFLSSFPPITILRKLKIKKGTSVIRLRESLVVFQFAVSLILIICTIFIYLQIEHTKKRSLGMDVERVLMIETNPDIKNHFDALQQELLATGVIESIGLSSQDMLHIGSNGGGWKWHGKPEEIDPLVSYVELTDGLLPTLNITMYDGRNFEQALDENTNRVIINKAFADLMGEEGRIEGKLWQSDDDWEETATIIGITNDFVFNGIYSTKSDPVMFYLSDGGGNLFIRVKPGDMQTSLQKIENVFKQIDPYHPFEYKFMEKRLYWMFHSELFVGKLAGLFAALAIFISCLGLFGLSAFAAEQRTREIGIRKVFGATIMNIVALVGRTFMILTGISFAIAIPLAWWIMHQWLKNYEYRIEITWWVFAASGVLVILVALLTVSFQSIKAAVTDPVKAIAK